MNITLPKQAPNDSVTNPVSKIMTRCVHTVRHDDTVVDALKLMADGTNTIPVLNEQEICVGMIARADVAESLLCEDQQFAQIIDSDGATPSLAGTALDTCGDKRVRELMSDDLKAVFATSPIKQACQLMADHDIHHLPVIDNQQKVVGIVSSMDLIKWFAQ